MILPSDKKIILTPKQDVIITIDGENKTYQQVKQIIVTIPNKKIHIIRKQEYNFIQKIRDKFLK